VVSSGGTVSSTAISAGGLMFERGGIDSGTVDLSRRQGVPVVGRSERHDRPEWWRAGAGGGSVVSPIFSSGAIEQVALGGSVSGIGVAAGVTLEVLSGGAASGPHVSRGGQVDIGSGGTATATVVSSGAVATVSGGTASGTIVKGGGSLVVLSGGVTVGHTLVGSGSTLLARETVSAGGVASGTALSNTGLLSCRRAAWRSARSSPATRSAATVGWLWPPVVRQAALPSTRAGARRCSAAQ